MKKSGAIKGAIKKAGDVITRARRNIRTHSDDLCVNSANVTCSSGRNQIHNVSHQTLIYIKRKLYRDWLKSLHKAPLIGGPQVG